MSEFNKNKKNKEEEKVDKNEKLLKKMKKSLINFRDKFVKPYLENKKDPILKKEMINEYKKFSKDMINFIKEKGPKIYKIVSSIIEEKKDKSSKKLSENVKSFIEESKKKSKTDPVWFVCYPYIFTFALAYILKNHTNDCLLIFDKGDDKELFNLKFGKDVGEQYTTNYKDDIFNNRKMELLAKRYLKCKKNNKILIVPMNPELGHKNVAFLNPFLNTFERYEPHGQVYTRDSDSEKQTDKQLEEYVNRFNKLLPEKDKLVVQPAYKTCPIKSGLQSFEGLAEEKLSKQEIKDKKTGVTFKDPGGFCCAWSLFMIDLRLTFPKVDMIKLQKEALKSFLGREILKEKDPVWSYYKKKDFNISNELRKFIRGFVSFIYDEAMKVAEQVKYNLEDEYEDITIEEIVKLYFSEPEKRGYNFKKSEIINEINNIVLNQLWVKGV